MAPSSPHLLSRLRKAITKVRFLISFNLRQWLLSSTATTFRRRLSLDSQPLSPGLLDVAEEFSYYLFDPVSSPPTRSSSSASQPLTRTISRAVSGSSTASSTDDINQRAEDFIENFYRQLRMERQVSLELRYN